MNIIISQTTDYTRFTHYGCNGTGIFTYMLSQIYGTMQVNILHMHMGYETNSQTLVHMAGNEFDAPFEEMYLLLKTIGDSDQRGCHVSLLKGNFGEMM